MNLIKRNENMSRYWQVEELAAYASGMTEEQYSEFLNDEGDFDEL